MSGHLLLKFFISAYICKVIVFGGGGSPSPPPHPSFCCSPGEFIGPHTQLCSGLWFLRVKDTQPCLWKEEAQGESPGENRRELQLSFPRGAMKDGLHPSSKRLWKRLWSAVYQESSLDLVPRGSIRVGHIGTLCLGPTKPPDSLKESRFPHKPPCSINGLGTVNHSSWEMVEPLLKSKLPDTSWRPTLQTGRCRDHSLRSALRTPFCTLIKRGLEFIVMRNLI